jgi:ferredoxin
MSQVIFELDGSEFSASPGDRFLDVLDDSLSHGLPIACRAGNCGTCRVRVIEGEHALEPPAAAEQKLLELCGAQRNERLGCQISVSACASKNSRGSGTRVRIERV